MFVTKKRHDAVVDDLRDIIARRQAIIAEMATEKRRIAEELLELRAFKAKVMAPLNAANAKRAAKKEGV